MARHTLERDNLAQWRVTATYPGEGRHRIGAALDQTVALPSENDILPRAHIGPDTLETFNTIVAGFENVTVEPQTEQIEVKRAPRLQKVRRMLGAAALSFKKFIGLEGQAAETDLATKQQLIIAEHQALAEAAREEAKADVETDALVTEREVLAQPELDDDMIDAIVEAQAVVYYGITRAQQRQYAKVLKYQENNLTNSGATARPMVHLFTHNTYAPLQPHAIAVESTRIMALVRDKLDADLATRAPRDHNGKLVDEFIAPTQNYSPDYVAQVLSS